ncbi:MAG: hypothetical protein LBP57_04900 [Endomicrobium sp.]|nr:hypothetical protein [Endomicrobium sp.]
MLVLVDNKGNAILPIEIIDRHDKHIILTYQQISTYIPANLMPDLTIWANTPH